MPGAEVSRPGLQVILDDWLRKHGPYKVKLVLEDEAGTEMSTCYPLGGQTVMEGERVTVNVEIGWRVT